MKFILLAVACLVNFIDAEDQCVFPFRYLGKTFEDCTTFRSDTGWCSLDAEYVGRYTACKMEKKCVFPFYYHERQMNGCVTYFSDKPWCSVTENFNGDFKYCDEDDLNYGKKSSTKAPTTTSTASTTTATTTTTTTAKPIPSYCTGRDKELNDQIRSTNIQGRILAPAIDLYRLHNAFDNSYPTCFATLPNTPRSGDLSLRIEFYNVVYVDKVVVRSCHILWPLMRDMEIRDERDNILASHNGIMKGATDYHFDTRGKLKELRLILRGYPRRLAISEVKIFGKPGDC